MILADTNVLSESSRTSADAKVMRWLAEHEARVHVPTVVLGELRYGCEKLPASARRRELEQWLSSLLYRFDGRIQPFGRDAADTHGKLRARLRALGKPASAPDSYIAAMGLALDCPIATRNTEDFQWTGAMLINPWET